MEIRLIDENYGNFKTAVFYMQYKFPPSIPFPSTYLITDQLINSYKASQVMYKGSSKLTGFGDFSEYNFSYKVDKDGFSDELVANKFSSSTRQITLDSSGIELINDTIFPTLSDEYLPDTDIYFGSMKVNSESITQLELLEGVWKVELYEGNIQSNNTKYGGIIDVDFLKSLNIDISINPLAIITLGPSSDLINNEENLYFDFDPLKANRVTSINNSDFLLLKDEVISKTSVLIDSSDKLSDSSINLSLGSWNISSNPNRNLNQQLVRNDEFKSSNRSYRGLTNLGEYIVDDISGNLIGNLETSRPIITNRLKIRNYTRDVYSPRITYRKGDKAELRGTIWESISDNNLNNDPQFSSKWVLSGSLANIFTDQVKIFSSPIIAGRGSLNDTVTVPSTGNLTFNVKEYYGYKVNIANPISTGKNLKLERNIDYVMVIDDLTDAVSITVVDWQKIIDGGNVLTFNFEYTGIPLNLIASYKGNMVDYSNWNTSFQNQLNVSELFLNNKRVPMVDSPITLTEDDEIAISFDKMTNYSISKVTSHYVQNYEYLEKDIELVEFEGKTVTKEDLVNYSKCNYVLSIIDREFSLKILNSVGYIVNSDVINLTLDNSGSIKFYKTDSADINVIIKSETGTDVEIGIDDLGNTITLHGSTTVVLSKDDSEIFELLFTNVQDDYEIYLN